MTNEKASQNKMLMTLKKEKIIFQKIIFKRVDKKKHNFWNVPTIYFLYFFCDRFPGV